MPDAALAQRMAALGASIDGGEFGMEQASGFAVRHPAWLRLFWCFDFWDDDADGLVVDFCADVAEAEFLAGGYGGFAHFFAVDEGSVG